MLGLGELRPGWQGRGSHSVSALARWPLCFRSSESQAHGSLFFTFGELTVQRLLGAAVYSTSSAARGWLSRDFLYKLRQELRSTWYPSSAFTFDMLSLLNYIYLSVYLCIMWAHKCHSIHMDIRDQLAGQLSPAMWIPGMEFRQWGFSRLSSLLSPGLCSCCSSFCAHFLLHPSWVMTSPAGETLRRNIS